MSYLKENNFVYVKDKGRVKISDVEIGDFILSRKNNIEDFYTEVKRKDFRDSDSTIKILTKNGIYIDVDPYSNVLNYNKVYEYSNDLDNIKIAITPSKKLDLYSYDPKLSEIGWFLGAHTGDGTCDRKLIKNTKEEYYVYRLRIIGDNQTIINRYAKFLNPDKNFKIRKVDNKNYKTDVWTYEKTAKSIKYIVDNYFDGKFGNKTYTGKVYSYISDNNLWIPYLSGLMDSDGSVKRNGTIEVSMCMKDVIDNVCHMLSKSGVRYHLLYSNNKRPNEAPMYRLTIYLNEEITKKISEHMCHEIKIDKINSGDVDKFVSPNQYQLSDEIYNKIAYTKFKNVEIKLQSFYSIRCLTKKHPGYCGLGGLVCSKNVGVITEEEYYEIVRRENIKEIVVNDEKTKTISLITESGNFYVGNFGFLNVSC